MKIILGSASPRRQQILKEMGYEFEVITADIDEKAIRDTDPQKLTLALAIAKADAIIPRLKEEVILITSDQVVFFKGKIIEKPESKEEAYAVLDSYASDPVQTVNGVVVTNTKTGKRFSGNEISTIYFNLIPKENIEKFVESGEVFGHAGSFAAEHPLFTPYIQKIEGSLDSVMGLPKDFIQNLIEEAQA